MSRFLQTSLFSDEDEEEALRVLVPSTSPASLPPRTTAFNGHSNTEPKVAVQSDDNEPPPIALVRDSSPEALVDVNVPETNAKLQRLQDVFGASKSTAVLQRSLRLAKGSVNDAIAIAVTMGDDEDDDEIIGILKGSSSPLTAFNPPATKKRRLVKKKDLKPAPAVEPIVVPVILKNAVEDDLQVLSMTAPPPPIYVIPSSPIQTFKNGNPPIKRADSPEEKNEILEDSDEEEDEAVSTDSETEDYSDNEGSLNKATVDYFNACTPDQLIDLTSCTKEQANSIIRLRPFSNLKQLRSMLETGGTLGGKKTKKLVGVLDRYTETMEGYAQVDALIDKVKSHGASLNAVLSKWGLSVTTGDGKGELCMTELPQRPEVIDHDMSECLYDQPTVINSEFTLKSYQLLGISWLNLLYSQNLSGILADEMGLGKTAQVIAFLGHLMTKGVQGPHLVICPSSTLDNWVREIERWCPTLTYRSYYGGQAERYEAQDEIQENIDSINVIVTTYNMATGNKDDRSFLRKLGCVTMILDEGHMVKNMESSRYKHLSRISAPFRLLLTGTPLQNNLMELLSLLHFVLPDLFSSDLEVLSKVFAIKSSQQSLLCKQRTQRAKEMMAPFVLRRRKDQVVRELPQKIISIQHCPQTEFQAGVYENVLKESKRSYLEAKGTADGTASKSEQRKAQSGANKQLSNVLMQLRKVANHPLLVRSVYKDDVLTQMSRQIMREPEYCDANPDYIFEDMTYMSDFELHSLCKKFKSLHQFALEEKYWMDAGKVQTLKSLLPAMKDRGDRILIFSQFVIMLDVLEEVMKSLDMAYLRLDGSTNVSGRQDIIDTFNTNADIPVFLISTKAGGVGINLTSANVVIIYDMDFNPHNDAQAEDRAHRVGQLRDVTVLKFVSSNTVEEHILRCANMKMKLDEQIRSGVDGGVGEDGLEDNVLEALRNEMAW